MHSYLSIAGLCLLIIDCDQHKHRSASCLQQRGLSSVEYFVRLPLLARLERLTHLAHCRLTFGAGVKQQAIRVRFTADTTPELAESFRLNLGTPSNGGVLGAIDSIVVTIAESDFPRGLLRFEPATQRRVAEPDAGNVTVTLDVHRAPGVIGSILVHYDVFERVEGTLTAAQSHDVAPVSDSIVFQDGVSIASITLAFLADSSPEITEDFVVILRSDDTTVSASSGEVEIVVEANDDPFGVIEFGSSTAVFATSEAMKVGRFEVHRSAGTFGTAVASWSLTGSMNSSQASSSITAGEGAAGDMVVVYDVAELHGSFDTCQSIEVVEQSLHLACFNQSGTDLAIYEWDRVGYSLVATLNVGVGIGQLGSGVHLDVGYLVVPSTSGAATVWMLADSEVSSVGLIQMPSATAAVLTSNAMSPIFLLTPNGKLSSSSPTSFFSLVSCGA